MGSVLKGVPEDQHPPRQPLDMQYEVGTVTAPNGVTVVVMEFRSPAGETTIFISPEDADKLAVHISRNASAARNRLMVAGPEHLRAIENGNRQQRRHPES